MIIEKYDRRAKEIDSLLCVGLDSDFQKLPERFQNTPLPQFEFNTYIIEQTHEFASAYKINSAFYEARGEQGVAELKMTADYLRDHHPEIFTILDAKRGDIGNTNNGYVESALDWLGFDAITISPYLGGEALAPFLSRVDKCSIILVKTSNPGSGEFQDLQLEGRPLWQHVAKNVAEKWNTNNNLMMVVGATYPEDIKTAREIAPEVTFLVPGVGAQGGDVQSVVQAGKRKDGLGLIINSSRGIIFAQDPRTAAEALRSEINMNLHNLR